MRGGNQADPFDIAGGPVGQDTVLLCTGLDFAPTATLGLSYEGQFSGGSTDQTVKGTLGVKF